MMQLQIIGNLGADAVEKEINGKKYISMCVASTKISMRVASTKKDRTTWVSVMYYYSERLLPYLKKGAQVFASGEMSVGTYTNRDGVTQVDVSVWANLLQLVGGKTGTDTQSQTWDDEVLPFT
jgi:single-strand DNA-binding protein